MNSKPVASTVLLLLVLAAALTVVQAAPLPLSYQIDGDQLTVNVSNPGPDDLTVSLTVFVDGESLGTAIFTVPAGSGFGTVWTIHDDVNPFDLGFSLLVLT